MAVLFPGAAGSATLRRQTQTAGTAIVDIFQARCGPTARMKVTNLQFECGGTANTIILMPTISVVKTYAAAAAAATSLVLEKDPGAYATNFPATRPPLVSDNLIAANDYISIKTPGGEWTNPMVVSAASTDATTGRVTLTVPALAVAIPAGTKVAFFGISTDLSPTTGKAPAIYQGVASTNTEFGNPARVLFQADLCDTPIMVYSANATAACILHSGSAFGAP